MEGFLGIGASLGADLSLIFVYLFGIAAIVGGTQARKGNYSRHCPVMATAAMLNWIPVLLVMTPGWLNLVANGLRGIAFSALTPAGIIPVLHGVIGAVTQLLMTYTVARMYIIKSLPPSRPLWLMRITIALWLLTVVGGTFVYMRTYAFV